MSFFLYSTSPALEVRIKGKVKKIWNSDDKRFKCPRFLCNFCGKLKINESFSVVDGGRSCKQCDGEE